MLPQCRVHTIAETKHLAEAVLLFRDGPPRHPKAFVRSPLRFAVRCTCGSN